MTDDGTRTAAHADDAEVVDALPVLADEAPRAEEPPVVPARPAGRSLIAGASPAVVTAAAVAATGFVAGAASVAVAAHRRRAKVSRRPLGPAADRVLGTRSYRVDVHLLDR